MGSYYAGVMNSSYNSELKHHGILGQKWGVQNGPPYPLTPDSGQSLKNSDYEYAIKNLKNAKVKNIDKWGKDAEHNVLYVAGYSGSGKSTTALGLKNPKDTVIHLDGYTEVEDPEYKSIQSKKFNNYLDKNMPNWRKMQEASYYDDSIEKFSDEYWKMRDEFRKQIESYSINQFKNGGRVIVEGVQILDGWYAGDSDGYFKDKPIAILGTGAIKSMKRAFDRDGRDPNLLKAFLGLNDPKDYVDWLMEQHTNANALSKSIEAERGKKYVDQFIRR